MGIIVLLLLTAMVYMAFPLIKLAANGGKFEKSRAHKIALWNSVAVGAFFCILSAATDASNTWTAAPAILYYYINRAVITDKDTSATTKDISTEKSPVHTVSPTDAQRNSSYTTPSNAQQKIENEEKTIQFCRKCGNKITISGSAFCNKCGEKLDWN